MKNEGLVVVNVEDGDVTRWFYVTTKEGKVYTIYTNHNPTIGFTDVEVEYSEETARVPEEEQARIKEAVLKHIEEAVSRNGRRQKYKATLKQLT